MPRHTVAAPSEALVGKVVRLYLSSGPLLVTGEVTGYLPDGDTSCACGTSHGPGLAMAPITEDPEIHPRLRKLLIEYVDRCILTGKRPVWPIADLRVEVED